MIRKDVNSVVEVGDKIKLTSVITVLKKDFVTRNGCFALVGRTEEGVELQWIYSGIKSVEPISRPHPIPKTGDIWKPRKHMLPWYFDGNEFVAPAGTSKMVSENGRLKPDIFFQRYGGAQFIINVMCRDTDCGCAEGGGGKQHE